MLCSASFDGSGFKEPRADEGARKSDRGVLLSYGSVIVQSMTVLYKYPQTLTETGISWKSLNAVQRKNTREALLYKA